MRSRTYSRYFNLFRSTESSGDSAADAIEDDDQIVDVGEESGDILYCFSSFY